MQSVPHALEGVGFWVPGTLIVPDSKSGFCPMPGISGFLARLKSRGLRLALANTFGSPVSLAELVELSGLLSRALDWIGEANPGERVESRVAAALKMDESRWLWVGEAERSPTGSTLYWLLQNTATTPREGGSPVGTWQDLLIWVYAHTLNSD